MVKEKIVSVIIPTYKRPDTLSRAIDSVLNQTYDNIEIIVVDDNEPDSQGRIQTEMVMEKYKSYLNIMYIKHEKNKNGSAARNTGIRNSKGEYLMFLDDDDEFLPKKVLSQVERMNSLGDDWAACYTNYVRKKDGKIVVYGAEKKEGSLLKEELMRNLFIHAGSNLLIRRNVVEEIKGFDESFQRNQDVEFLTRILMKYKLAYVNEVGLIVYTHDNKENMKKFEHITSQYKERFNSIIKQLSATDQKEINLMIDLQLFRYYVLTKGKRKLAWEKLVSNEIPLITAVRYFLHLVNRKITKRAYGFKL